MPTAHTFLGLLFLARLQLSEGHGHSHGHVALEVGSNGVTRRLVRREASDRRDGLFAGKPGSGAASSSASTSGNFSAPAQAQCDETQQLCCKPAKLDPRGLYRMCLERNCRRMESPDPICEEKGICTKDCTGGCCCFWLGCANRVKQFGIWAKRNLIQVAVMLLAFQQGSVQAAEKQPSAKVNERDDPQEVAAHAVDVVLDACKWGVGMPLFALLAVLLHARARGLGTKPGKASTVPEAQLTPAEREELERQKQADLQREVREILGPRDEDRLGGIERLVVAKMSGISDLVWMLTQALGLGLHYCLISDHAQTGICVLGKSGRLLVLNRKPMLLSTTAASMFRGAGVTHIILVMIANTYLRAVERALMQAQLSHDPAIAAKAAQAEPLAKAVYGKVTYITLAIAVVLWLIYFVILKTSIRPWGAKDERNYYESKEASVGQYYRGGSRGLIPCLSRRRRKGGLRIFFGPYPEKHIFGALGRESATLQNIEPCLMLPTETDNGYPQSGSGQPASAEEKAARATLILSSLNGFLGTLGLVVFGIHVYNFLVNVQNCPMGDIVRDCVGGADCTRVAKTPWFAHYVVSNKLRTQSEVVMDQLLPKVETKTLGIWLRTGSAAETRAKVLNISREACHKRYKELVVDPNHTLYAATADTIAKFNAANYLYLVKSYGYQIRFDAAALHCQDCTRSLFLYYFTSFDNLVEIIEVMVLLVTTYVSAKVYQMSTRKLTNCPMVDLAFASDPGSATELDVDKLEQTSLAMIGHCFSFRYHYRGVPKYLEDLENDLRKKSEDTTLLADPWQVDDTATSWNSYDISSPGNRRLMVVNRKLLGILEGEEIVAAWSETPKLSTGQNVCIFGGFLIFFVVPLVYAVLGRSVACAVEAFVMELIHWGLLKFYIFSRRPQAGFVLTSRRLFQVSRLPAYRDFLGKTEPMVKLDVLVHNSGLTYGSLAMEAYTPLWRRALGKILNVPVYRRGQLIFQGQEGIFKLWRLLGDTREVFNAMSKVTMMTGLDRLSPQMGADFQQKERASQQGEESLPDPACACCCCPHTPPQPIGFASGSLLDRWVTRKPREKGVYGRKLTIRPSTCRELCCGRGCNIEFGCCCCCRLDELLTDFIITTHRILVEQRSLQRYCRWYACCRNTPNIRVTFLAHHRAAAYLCEKDAQAFGFTRVKQDMNLKLLQKDAREYSSGLMLVQRPYVILSKQDAATFKDKLWVSHIAALYDIMTQEQENPVDPNGSREGSQHDDELDEEAAFAPAPRAVEEPLPPSPEKGTGKRGKATKGKGKSSLSGKGKGKTAGRKGLDDAGPGKGSAAAAAAAAADEDAPDAAAGLDAGDVAAAAGASYAEGVVEVAGAPAATAGASEAEGGAAGDLMASLTSLALGAVAAAGDFSSAAQGAGGAGGQRDADEESFRG